MSAEAEIAAGRAVNHVVTNESDWETIENTWNFDDLSDEQKAVWIKIGMAAVHAYQRATWREPTAEGVRLQAAEKMAETYRKIILRDAGAPEDADSICCCGGKLGEAGYDWPCTHGGCRSMADYYLSKKIEETAP